MQLWESFIMVKEILIPSLIHLMNFMVKLALKGEDHRPMDSQ